MPFKVILAKRAALQQALDKWSDDIGPIKVGQMTQSMDRDGDSVTLVIFYTEGSGPAGAGYGASEAPRARADADKKDEDFGECPECPQCGSEMVIRRRKADGIPFWGCTQFPTCRGIVNIDDDDAPTKGEKKNGKKNGKKSEKASQEQGSFGFNDDDDIPF